MVVLETAALYQTEVYGCQQVFGVQLDRGAGTVRQRQTPSVISRPGTTQPFCTIVGATPRADSQLVWRRGSQTGVSLIGFRDEKTPKGVLRTVAIVGAFDALVRVRVAAGSPRGFRTIRIGETGDARSRGFVAERCAVARFAGGVGRTRGTGVFGRTFGGA